MRHVPSSFACPAFSLALPALAQTPPAPAPAPASRRLPAAAANAAAIPPELATLLDVLRDDTRRAALICALEATPGAAAAAAPATPEEVISAPAELVVGISRVGLVLTQVFAALSAATELSAIGDWFQRLFTDDRLQAMVLALAWKLAIVLLCGLAVDHLLRSWMRPNAWLEARGPAVAGPMQGVRRLPYMAGHLALDIVPILGFGARRRSSSSIPSRSGLPTASSWRRSPSPTWPRVR